jgi:hypothetical protein
MNYKAGIHYSDAELKAYMEKSAKYDKIVALAKEENTCRSRIKAIAQERSKIIGVV